MTILIVAILIAIVGFCLGFLAGYHALKYDSTSEIVRLYDGVKDLAELAKDDPVRYGIELGKEWSLQQIDEAKDRIARASP